jgi:NAD(P)-dependent dehydrogenase (short-subunit alcohol dehydrogenase family)
MERPWLRAEVGGMGIDGRSVLVTGGSRGLGAALARELARRGGRVVIVGREGGPLREVVAEIWNAGGEAHALAADVGDPAAVHPLIGAASALVGPLDVVVHNASTLGRSPLRELADTEDQDFARALEVNLLGPFRITKAVVGSMLLRRRGLVVSVTSDAAVVAYPRWGAYGVSKAALEQLMRTWAQELGESGVRFLSVDPGEMDTRMHKDAVPDADPATLASPDAVATRMADLIEAPQSWPSGTRVELASLRSAA